MTSNNYITIRALEKPSPTATLDTLSPEMLHIVHRLKNYRVEILKASPSDFARSYDAERNLPVSEWLDQLAHATATHYVALGPSPLQIQRGYRAADVDREGVANGEWYGMLILHRLSAPISAKTNPWFPQSTPSTPAQDMDVTTPSPAYFHLGGLYVLPLLRKQGVASMLIKRAMDDAVAIATAEGKSSVKFGLAVNNDNIAAQRVYGKLGFVAVETQLYSQMGQEKVAVTMSCERQCPPRS